MVTGCPLRRYSNGACETIGIQRSLAQSLIARLTVQCGLHISSAGRAISTNSEGDIEGLEERLSV